MVEIRQDNEHKRCNDRGERNGVHYEDSDHIFVNEFFEQCAHEFVSGLSIVFRVIWILLIQRYCIVQGSILSC